MSTECRHHTKANKQNKNKNKGNKDLDKANASLCHSNRCRGPNNSSRARCHKATRSQHTHNRRPQQSKAKPATNVGHNFGVGLLMLVSHQGGNALIQSSGWSAKATRCREHSRHKGSMLYMPNTLLVFALLLSFMTLVDSVKWWSTSRGSIRVEHPYINQCPLETASPQTTDTNVQSGLIILDGCPIPQLLTG